MKFINSHMDHMLPRREVKRTASPQNGKRGCSSFRGQHQSVSSHVCGPPTGRTELLAQRMEHQRRAMASSEPITSQSLGRSGRAFLGGISVLRKYESRAGSRTAHVQPRQSRSNVPTEKPGATATQRERDRRDIWQQNYLYYDVLTFVNGFTFWPPYTLYRTRSASNFVHMFTKRFLMYLLFFEDLRKREKSYRMFPRAHVRMHPPL